LLPQSAQLLPYNDLVHRWLPRLETGFDPVTEQFDERRLMNRASWPCLRHLHGSVHFDMRHAGSGPDLYEIHW